jgi:uncharacterized protein (TIGR02145 family)
VEDVDGFVYKVTSLAKLCWTENLRTVTNPFGNPIEFANVYTCSTCPSGLDTIFGLLYTWYSATDNGTTQGICPEGWHIPTQAEWGRLGKYQASQLKSTQYWLDPLGPGTDDFGFDARPAGWYNGAIDRYQDLYAFAGWWAFEDNVSNNTASYFRLTYFCDWLEETVKHKTDGLSVRCVKDYDY